MQASHAIPHPRVAADGLRKTMMASFGVHVAVVLALFVLPRDWLVRAKPEPILMTLSMGTPGERTSGMTPMGGRPVQEVAPPPKRAEPLLPVSPPKTPAISTAPPKKATPPPKTETPIVSEAPPRPPTTGAQVRTGTSAAATNAVGQGPGLSVSGGLGGTSAKLDENFCCPEYMKEQLRRIQEIWARTKNQPEVGETTVVFEILKDGTFTKPQIEKTSGSVLLDLASQAAFVNLRLQPLPENYPGQTLKVHLTFPYVR